MFLTSPSLALSAVLFINVRFGEADDKPECGYAPYVGGGSPPQPIRPKSPLGAAVTYTCFIAPEYSGSRQTVTCVYDNVTGSAVWSNPEVNCTGYCADPGHVSHATRVDAYMLFPFSVTYYCHDGYILQGSPFRICRFNGTWTGKRPSCKIRHSAPVKAPYDKPQIIPSSIDDNEAPDASAESSCRTQDVQHGKFLNIRTYVLENQNKYRFEPVTEIVEVNETSFDDGSLLYVTCETPYILQGKDPDSAVRVQCLEQQWVPRPICVLPHQSVPRETPSVKPHIIPSSAVANEVTVPSPETGGGCSLSTLLFSGLDRSGKQQYKHDDVIIPKCEEYYELSKPRTPEMKCVKGQWQGVIPPCKPASCRSKPPSVRNALIDTIEHEHGTTVTYTCRPNFEMTSYGSVKCVFGAWIGDPPVCTKSLQGCKPLEVEEGSNIIIEPVKDFYNHGEVIEFDCPFGLELSVDVEMMMCLSDGWSEDTIPTCKAP